MTLGFCFGVASWAAFGYVLARRQWNEVKDSRSVALELAKKFIEDGV
jgi:hypothetical protein